MLWIVVLFVCCGFAVRETFKDRNGRKETKEAIEAYLCTLERQPQKAKRVAMVCRQKMQKRAA